MPAPGGRRTVATMKRLLVTLALLAAVGAAYSRWLRQPILTWGATDEEAAGRLPGR